jgi:hypothetical protein
VASIGSTPRRGVKRSHGERLRKTKSRCA